MNISIDEEWTQFMSTTHGGYSDDSDEEIELNFDDQNDIIVANINNDLN